jgi:hypothetical protein
MQRGDARPRKVRQAQLGQQRRTVVAPPLADCRQTTGASQGRGTRQGQNGD